VAIALTADRRRRGRRLAVRLGDSDTASMAEYAHSAQAFHTTRRCPVSLVAPGDGSLDQAPTAMVPIASLLPANSPRIEGENAEHVRTLAELDGATPPIIVHRPTMRVIDGMHRLHATLRGHDTIDVRFFDGCERDVFVLAVELNSRHGLPLSPADRATAAARVLSSHPHWSDRVITSLTGLSAKTVASIRQRSTQERT
jgi:hypothetical protein